MPHDYEDIFDLDDLNDQELRELVRDALARHDGIDADSIVVRAGDGVVRLMGRVGTEGERRIADHVLSDVIGLRAFENEIVVDALHRDASPEDAEDAAAQAAEGSGEPLGRPHGPRDGEDADEDELDGRLYGTHDVQAAIGDGTSWIPPEAPTQEGHSENMGDWDPFDDEETTPDARP
jgi:hypothetical protein